MGSGHDDGPKLPSSRLLKSPADYERFDNERSCTKNFNAMRKSYKTNREAAEATQAILNANRFGKLVSNSKKPAFSGRYASESAENSLFETNSELRQPPFCAGRALNMPPVIVQKMAKPR
jgi:hypothetical protein